jgi:hypothetical protein
MFEDAISGQGRGPVSRGRERAQRSGLVGLFTPRPYFAALGVTRTAPCSIAPESTQVCQSARTPQQLTAQQDHIAGAEKPSILVLRWVLSEPSLAARLPARVGSRHAESLPLE